MTDESIEERETPLSLRSKLIGGVVVALLVVGGAWLMLRVSSPAILAGQAPPAGHYTLDCGFCHAISAEPAAEGL